MKHPIVWAVFHQGRLSRIEHGEGARKEAVGSLNRAAGEKAVECKLVPVKKEKK